MQLEKKYEGVFIIYLYILPRVLTLQSLSFLFFVREKNKRCFITLTWDAHVELFYQMPACHSITWWFVKCSIQDLFRGPLWIYPDTWWNAFTLTFHMLSFCVLAYWIWMQYYYLFSSRVIQVHTVYLWIFVTVHLILLYLQLQYQCSRHRLKKRVAILSIEVTHLERLGEEKNRWHRSGKTWTTPDITGKGSFVRECFLKMFTKLSVSVWWIVVLWTGYKHVNYDATYVTVLVNGNSNEACAYFMSSRWKLGLGSDGWNVRVADSSLLHFQKQSRQNQSQIIESYVFGLLLCGLTPEWTPSITQSILTVCFVFRTRKFSRCSA